MDVNDAGAALTAARDAYLQNDWRAQERFALQALGTTQDDADRAMAFHHLGLALYHRNAAEDARSAYQKAIEAYARIGDTLSIAFVQVSLGSVELDLLGDSARARELCESALTAIRDAKREEPLGIALGNLAEALRLEGEYRRALDYAGEALEHFRAAGDNDHAGWQLITIANCHSLSRHYPQAFEALRDAYAALEPGGNPRWLANYFDAVLMLAVTLRKWREAAKLGGFLDRYRHDHRVVRLAGLAMWYRLSVQQIDRNLLADESFELRMQGAAFSVADAQNCAEQILEEKA